MDSKNQPQSLITRYKNIFIRTKNLIISPQNEWETIHNEKSDFNKILSEFALPYLAVITLISFINSIMAHQDPDFTFALKNAIGQFTAFFLTLFISYYILIKIIPQFAKTPKTAQVKDIAIKTVAYSMVVIFILRITTLLIPQIYFLQIAGLYTAFLVWHSTKHIGEFENKDFRIVLTIIISLLILFLPYLLWVMFIRFSGI
ncbi:Yip1 family protein [Plebeiibacterium sediminum]|uniref:YIP1 family protein n=1 Tax=Plebeiibacterium sediminum TaxID=2992112 RepID=A0AAE3SH14_9BACT|nr:Yip1 family protein [Plebeiobacterium sediminum]MCW3789058.1 YIP1 family protein [Plebeiobacterium sediminum]